MAKTIRWVKVADFVNEIDFQSNGIAEVDAAGKTICIAKFKDQLFAFTQNCPHASGLLCNGFIDAVGNVVCPLHRYKFSISNGRNVTGEGYYLKHWPVQVKEEGVFVGFEQSGLFGF